MKPRSAFLIVLSLFLFASAVPAAEQLLMEPAATFPETHASGTFRAVVNADGRLTLDPGPVFTEGVEEEGTELPYLISTPKPIVYPRWALHQGWQGELVLALEILPTGEVGRFYTMRSSGYEILDEAAAKAVKTWKFQPAMLKGKPVLTCIQLPVRFQIKAAT